MEEDHEERLRDLRERLYSRGAPPSHQERKELSDEPKEVPVSWLVTNTPPPEISPIVPLVSMRRPKTSYRVKIIVGGLLFFMISLALSGSFLLFGKNVISGNNIDIKVEGPFAVGGGDVMEAKVSIANQNAVPIESATLILEYPSGTQSTEELGKELLRERKQLNRINPGEVVNIPLRIKIFGEENEEKNIKVSIEYRVEGSNAAFLKEAEPLRFKVSSSPVILFIDNVQRSTSGQEIEISIAVSSNAPNEISNILLKGEYPQGFDFSSAEPSPVSGRDTWSVPSLRPGEKKTIKIKGILMGKQSETKVFKFSVGVPNERDRFSLASVFTTQSKEVLIEDPFLEIKASINGQSGDTVSIAPGGTAQVSISFTNSLPSTLYDGKIVVNLSGNALDEREVTVPGGFYDSNNKTITWDGNDTESLKIIGPGRASTVTFSLTARKNSVRTPQISFSVSAEGNRLSEDRVSQKLSGTISKTIKVESTVKLSSSIFYSQGSFENSGPVPPRAEETTKYSVYWYVKNGSNAVADGVVTATLPPYVAWLAISTTPSVFSYNTQTREVSWKVGDLTAEGEREAEFQISVRPSESQVGQEITLVNEQRLRVTDRFTGSALRSETPALTSRLLADPEYEGKDGRVVSKNE